MKKQIELWESEIKDTHWKEEFQGIFKAVLHLRNVLDYMRSPEAKEYLTKELGEMPYLEQIRLTERNLKTREMELEFTKSLLTNQPE